MWTPAVEGGSRLFYKCDMARRLDTEIGTSADKPERADRWASGHQFWISGDLVVQARDAELEILGALLERLRRLEARLRKAAQLLAEVDVIQAP